MGMVSVILSRDLPALIPPRRVTFRERLKLVLPWISTETVPAIFTNYLWGLTPKAHQAIRGAILTVTECRIILKIVRVRIFITITTSSGPLPIRIATETAIRTAVKIWIRQMLRMGQILKKPVLCVIPMATDTAIQKRGRWEPIPQTEGTTRKIRSTPMGTVLVIRVKSLWVRLGSMHPINPDRPLIQIRMGIVINLR